MKKINLLIVFLAITFVTQSQTIGTLTVSTNTSTTSSPVYSPRNVVAIWIEDSNGNFVKTLLALADLRKQYLSNWRIKTTVAGSVYNTVDAITGATQMGHEQRSANWNGQNRSSILVADGTYKVKMEVADNSGLAQNLAEFSFVKGTSEQILTPSSINGFSNISIKWTPINTSINDIEKNSPYQIFPSNAIHTLYIKGANVNAVKITDINGKPVISSNKTIISVINLPKGVYFANIITEDGNHIRKFIK